MGTGIFEEIEKIIENEKIEGNQKKEISSLIKNVGEKAKIVLSKKRFEHSCRVAKTAFDLCKIHGEVAWKALLCGLSHDFCKEIPEDKMRSLALLDGRGESAAEQKKTSLLHGRAAAVCLSRDFGIVDFEILDAVAFHTLGKKGLCNLGKIIFVADKIEPGRPQSTEEYRSRLFSLPLNELTLSVLEENIEYLLSKGKKAAAESLEWATDLRETQSKKTGGTK